MLLDSSEVAILFFTRIISSYVAEEIYEKYRKAGRVNAEAGEFARTLVKPGISVKEIATRIEHFITEKGVSLSFPVNISLDDCAAHYSPSIDDDFTLPQEGLLKIDLGTHVDGYIADHAITVDISCSGGVYRKLIDAAEKALRAAIEHFKAGQDVVTVGKNVEETITNAGFLPIRNLGGHNLGQYSLHGGVFVPNTGSGFPYKIKPGDVFAIEPFATTGKGVVFDGPKALIYRFNKRPKRQMNMQFMSYLETIRKNFNQLPFSPRWLQGKIPANQIMPAITMLAKADALQSYPLLMEQGKGLVSQAEHTVIVHENDTEVTTAT